MNTEVLLKYQNLIYKMSNRFYGVSKEDLVQAGFVGLLKAYKNYDPNRNVSFSTYAYDYIYGEMYECESKSKNVFVNKNMKRLYKKVISTKDMLSQKYNREISLSEVCEFLNVDINLIMDIINSSSDYVPIEETVISENNNLDNLILLKNSLNKLNDLEKQIIKERFISDYTQEETARKLGISQSKVSRIESKSKEKIKTYIRG